MNVRRLTLTALVTAIVFGPYSLEAAPRGPDAEPDEIPAAMQTRIYVGMWTTHIRDIHRGLDANALVGIAHRGYFGGTLVNSFGDRAFVAGVQRSFTSSGGGGLKPVLGYRLGLITGYDERFLGGIGGKSPVLPFAQIVGNLDHRILGLELAYSGLAASVAFNFQL